MFPRSRFTGPKRAPEPARRDTGPAHGLPAQPAAPAAPTTRAPGWKLFSRKSALAALVLGAASTLPLAPARAALGDKVASVELDRQQIHATTHVTPRAAYAVHELQGPGGDVVREYVSPAGVVFGISWVGKTLPNLRQLLGLNFDTFAGSTHRQRGGRGHLVVTEGNLVVESTGRMRSFRGHAYLSNAIPTGVTLHDIQ
jgi:hypothetical protein